MARATRATRTGTMPKPTRVNIRMMMPSDGMARPRLVRLTATRAPRPVWPMAIPMGKAMAVAMEVASSEYQRCWRVRTGIPSGPLHWAGSVSQATTSLTTSMAGLPAAAPGPGGEPVLQGDQQGGGGGGQQRREHDPDDDRGGEVQGEAVDEQPAQPAPPDQRGAGEQPECSHAG